MFSKRRPQAKSKNLQTPGTLLYYFKRTKLHYHYLLPPFLPPLLCHACCHLIKRLDFKHLPIGRFFSSAASSLSLKISSNLLSIESGICPRLFIGKGGGGNNGSTAILKH